MLPEEAVLPARVPVRVAIGVRQAGAPGPNRVKVTVPKGADPPDRRAVSEMLPPAGVEPDGVVAMVGPALPPAPAQVLTLLLSSVTAPVCAYRLPVALALALTVMDVLARM